MDTIHREAHGPDIDSQCVQGVGISRASGSPSGAVSCLERRKRDQGPEGHSQVGTAAAKVIVGSASAVAAAVAPRATTAAAAPAAANPPPPPPLATATPVGSYRQADVLR
ncbi:unnamed protein product [Closterium sp. NIES-54]